MNDHLEGTHCGTLMASRTPAQCLYIADPRRLSILEIKIIAQASIQVSTSNDNNVGTSSPTSLSSDPLSSSKNTVITSSTSSDHTLQQEKQERRARRVYSLRPKKVSFENGRSESLSSTWRSLQISSHLEVYSTRSQWDRIVPLRREVHEVGEAGSSNGNGRAGVFSAVRKDELDTEASEDESDNDDTEQDFDTYTDSRQLPLKVSPPIDYLRQQNVDHTEKRSSSITMKARLQATAVPSQTPRSSSKSPAGPRTMRTTSDETISKRCSSIVFVSTYSSSKLYAAVGSTRKLADEDKFKGPLSSLQNAEVEGIDWKVVEGEDDTIKFEWKRKPLSGDQTSHGETKCACAIIELNPYLPNARILASFCFLIDLPSDKVSATGVFHQPQGLPLRKSAPTIGSSTMAEAGVGLGLCQEGSPTSVPATNKSYKSEDDHPRLPRVSGDAIGLSKTRRHHSNGSSSMQINLALKTTIQVDFAEICLEDVEEDGPILRAVLANLEKRTASLNKAAKVIVKAAEEVRNNLYQLQTSEANLAQSLEAAAHLAPHTLGYLNSQVLHKRQREVLKERQEQIEMLQNCVEIPLLALVDLCKDCQEQSKHFEVESKTYYAGTQKWLSSRSAAFPNGMTAPKDSIDVYSPSAVGYDKASYKQERIDDKQRLRHARFHLARLDIFRAVNNVHGGEAELQVASHLLTLCRWQCTDKASKEVIQGFQSALQLEKRQIEERSERLQHRYKEVEEQIKDLNALLGITCQDAEVVEPVLTNGESVAVSNTKHRQPGNRFKNLLTSLSSNKQSQSTAGSPHPCGDLQGSNILPSKCSPPHSSDGFAPNSRAPSASTVDGKIASFSEKQQKPRPLSYANHQRSPKEGRSHWRKSSISESTSSSLLCRSVSTGEVSPRNRDFSFFHRSFSPQRSSSSSSSVVSPRARKHSFTCAIAESSSPTLDRHLQSTQIGTSHAQSTLQSKTLETLDKEIDEHQPSKMSLLQPRRAAQQSRKKEGILWAMTKPIGGSVGADAPKSVSRSQNWRECWVVLSGSGHLGQYTEWKDVKVMEASQPLIDLKFATVREARGVERRFTFEVITRDNRRFFQANNEEEMKNWIKAISFAIESLLNGTSSIRQIDKVARVAGGHSSFEGVDGEFGSQLIEPSALGRHRAFSQSLTDLSTASSSAKLFSRSGNREELARKRESKGSYPAASGHLSALSEGCDQYNSTAIDLSSTPNHQFPWISHERGISNKTPISDYVQKGKSDGGDSGLPIPLSWTIEPDYDRKIEEMIHSSFGGAAHYRSTSGISSISPTRQSSQASQREVMTAIASSSSLSSSSDRYTRSKEILDIAARVENSSCADCQSENPRWASWNLNGEPRCIFICITCSGHHRGLGVGVSRVKSVDLDDWTEEQLGSARKWGNIRVNSLYESKKPRGISVTTTKGKQFWIDKYVNRLWCVQEAEEQRHSQVNRSSIDTDALPQWHSSPPRVFVSMSQGDEVEDIDWRAATQYHPYPRNGIKRGLVIV